MAERNSYEGSMIYTSDKGITLSSEIDTSSANKLMNIHNGIREILEKEEVFDLLNFSFHLDFGTPMSVEE